MGHQLVAILISVIGVVSLCEPEIGKGELVRRQRLYINPEPAKERDSIFQMQTISPGAWHAAGNAAQNPRCLQPSGERLVSGISRRPERADPKGGRPLRETALITTGAAFPL